MKKRLLGEKTGSKAELKRISFVIFFFLSTIDISPQIPINGFCKLNYYNFSPGFTNIFSFNFNNDSYSDLLLFNPGLKKIAIAAGEQNEKFSDEKVLEFPYHISSIIPLREKNKKIKKYAFTSRKDLTAGICEFSKEGKPTILQHLKFEAYPEKLNAADVNIDGTQEMLIAGPAFDGLSILESNSAGLKEKKITSRGTFSEAIFIELTNDNYRDAAAINLLNNTLDFYFNNGRSEYRYSRSINLNDKSSNLRTFDMNLDSYSDLIFNQVNRLQIIYGDFASAYSKQVEVETKYSVTDFIIGDFNKDGKIDLVYLSTDASIVSIFFAESEFSFYPEVEIHRKPGVKNLIPFYSRFIDGFAAICDDGKIFTNTQLKSFSSDDNISLNIQPEAISSFDANSDGIVDFCFIDNFSKSLKLIVRGNDGNPANFYSVRLRDNHSEIEANSFSKQSTTFFCYAKGKKLIEVVDVDFKTGKILRNEFYSARPITEVKSIVGEKIKIFVSSLANNRLTLEIFEKENSWKLLTDYTISEKVIAIDLSVLKGLNLFFWTQEKDSLKLFRKSFLPQELKAEIMLKLKMPGVLKILMKADDFHNLEKESVISFVDSNEKQYILVTVDGLVNKFDLESFDKDLKAYVEEQLSSSEIKINGTRRLIFNNFNDESIYRLNILRKGKKINFTKMRDEIKTKKYFVKNLTMNNFHIVYINQQKGCISVRQI